MLDKLKRLGTETAIYGVSTILGRFLNFLLVPFYTNVLVPGDYGIVAYVFSLIAFVNVVYGYGMESAYFKYSSTREIGTSVENFSTPFISLVATSLLFSCLLTAFASPVAASIALPASQVAVVRYTSWILFFDTAAIIPFAALRMEGKASLFATVKTANILINVGANLVLLLAFHAGVDGIFQSALIASMATFVLLLPTIARRFSFAFVPRLFKALLAFGGPYVPAGLAAMMIQVVDRPVLRILTNDATVGIYQANYRLGIFMMLVVAMFDYAWRPFFLNNAAEPDAKKIFSRVLTYFILGTSLLFLCVSFFISDLVHIKVLGRYVIHPDYWSGLSIVPVILLAYMFLGVFNNLIAGIYIEKKTHHLPIITATGALVNVGANLLLIPAFDMMGAAIATLLSYAVMALMLYADVRRFYPVQYEWGRIAKIAVVAAAVYGVFAITGAYAAHVLWKALLLVLFLALMYLFRFFSPEELGLLARLRPRWAVPGSSGDSPTEPR